ncbi:MAG: hypothetical protein AB7E95_12245 [Kiritimatiellales bacterium]
MRQMLGNSVIFQVDGCYPYKGFRGYRYISGLELEGFPQYNDYDSFSQSFQQLQQYSEKTDYPNHFSYPFTKQVTTVFGDEYENGEKTDYRFRIGLAAACLTGNPHPYAAFKEGVGGIENEGTFGIFDWDEYYGGDLNEIGWLGEPLNDAQRDMGFGPDLLAGESWTLRAIDPYEGCLSNKWDGSYEVHVTSIPEGGSHQYNQVALVSSSPILLVPGQEYTIVFDAIGTASWTVGSNTLNRVPSLIRVGFGADKKSDVTVDMSWNTYYLSAVAATNSTQIEFALAEQIGMRRIKNIRLYAGGGDRFIRDFTNGLVILNASRTAWTNNINGVYRRLRATPHPVTGELMAEDVNDGSFIGDNVVIPAMDAVFLKKMYGWFYFESHAFGNRLKSVDGETAFDLTGDYGGRVQWQLTPADGEYYYIENMTYDNQRLKAVDGLNAFDLTDDYGDKVQWRLGRAEGEYYYLENKAFDNRRLRSDDGGTSFSLTDITGGQVQWRLVSP